MSVPNLAAGALWERPPLFVQLMCATTVDQTLISALRDALERQAPAVAGRRPQRLRIEVEPFEFAENVAPAPIVIGFSDADAMRGFFAKIHPTPLRPDSPLVQLCGQARTLVPQTEPVLAIESPYATFVVRGEDCDADRLEPILTAALRVLDASPWAEEPVAYEMVELRVDQGSHSLARTVAFRYGGGSRSWGVVALMTLSMVGLCALVAILGLVTYHLLQAATTPELKDKQIDLLTALQRWNDGVKVDDRVLAGSQILWWGRLGKVVEAIAGALLIAEVVGPARLRRFGFYLEGSLGMFDLAGLLPVSAAPAIFLARRFARALEGGHSETLIKLATVLLLATGFAFDMLAS